MSKTKPENIIEIYRDGCNPQQYHDEILRYTPNVISTFNINILRVNIQQNIMKQDEANVHHIVEYQMNDELLVLVNRDKEVLNEASETYGTLEDIGDEGETFHDAIDGNQTGLIKAFISDVSYFQQNIKVLML